MTVRDLRTHICYRNARDTSLRRNLVLNPPLNVLRIVDESGITKLIDFLTKQSQLADTSTGFDIETTPLKDFYFRRCRTVQFGNKDEQFVVDLLALCDGDSDLLFSAQGEYGKNLHTAPRLRAFIEQLRPFLTEKKLLICGVNLGFEYMSFYWLFGMRTFNFFDCSMVEKCIVAGSHSMKDYGYFSMEEMMLRYFKVQIEKELQTSFDLSCALTDAQIEYAALDTRFPLAIKAAQELVLNGETVKSLQAKGNNGYKILQNLDPLVLGDNLVEIARIENDAIGAFHDMHIHGERVDREKWLARITGKKEELKKLLSDELDPIFLPIVGSKSENFTDEHIEAAQAKWKALNVVTDAELKLKSEIRKAKKMKDKIPLLPGITSGFISSCCGSDTIECEPFISEENSEDDWYPTETDRICVGCGKMCDAVKTTLGGVDAELKLKSEIRVCKKNNPELLAGLEEKLSLLQTQRKYEKEVLKTAASEMSKKRTKIKNLAAKCEGEALINYGSDTQLLSYLKQMKGLKSLTNLEDETLEKYEHYPVMAAIRKYHGLSKEIGTYGEQWATEWVTKPCKEEGWLHPGDGRLHCNFNQYEAETGRSSSSQPNAQNLPQDTEVRSCFIADPPDESIRISTCCDAETQEKFNNGMGGYLCTACNALCETKPEEYVIITADMSGAELRIIAELANDPVWIGAFNRGEDVHSVGTEILYAEKWPKLALPDCAYYKLKENGEPQRQKCKCPEHKTMRDDNKSTNFLLAYGGGPYTLAARTHKKLEEAKEIMHLHSQKFPLIWSYLEKSGKTAQMLKKSFDMFGRRRLFPVPTQERARQKASDDREEKLKYPEEVAENNIKNFTILHKRKPTKEELWPLEHRQPSQTEISNAFVALHSSIERQGKNHSIQGTNASLIKLAMGSGFDKDGNPYLWHLFPKYNAKLIKMVHDELVVQAPKRHAKTVAGLIGDSFKRAAATKMSRVVMEFDFGINSYWKK